MLARIAAAALVLAALIAAPAAAMPGDPPVTPLEPADGATVPVNPDGIAMSFECPVYRIDEPGGFPLFGGARDYGVSIGRSPATGAATRSSCRCG